MTSQPTMIGQRVKQQNRVHFTKIPSSPILAVDNLLCKGLFSSDPQKMGEMHIGGTPWK